MRENTFQSCNLCPLVQRKNKEDCVLNLQELHLFFSLFFGCLSLPGLTHISSQRTTTGLECSASSHMTAGKKPHTVMLCFFSLSLNEFVCCVWIQSHKWSSKSISESRSTRASHLKHIILVNSKHGRYHVEIILTRTKEITEAKHFVCI